jgi:hypothetical protein
VWIGPRYFSFSPERPDRLWGPLSLLFSGYRGSLSRVKRPWREVDHSRPSSAEVRNEWSCTSTLPICLHGVDREKYLLHGWMFPGDQL